MTAKHPKPRRPRTARAAGGKRGYLLKLFIAGMSPRSVAAIQSIQKICDQHLPGDYQLEVIDLYRHPARAKKEQIIAAPTLIKEQPLPLRRMVGGTTDEARVVTGLNVSKK